ncbi:fatty acid--CoA ligase family protein [Thiotrichales bacterium 19S3-7]|nr:fatty acid--CoA ligase family protein [Thiotrichales bacterium 19S3-7]MCF6803071.1 fatty acid--CoA ligase family protein [Thiotrichales bacterium 19S3-11]
MKTNLYKQLLNRLIELKKTPDEIIIETDKQQYSAGKFYYDISLLSQYFSRYATNKIVLISLSNCYELSVCYIAAIISKTRLVIGQYGMPLPQLNNLAITNNCDFIIVNDKSEYSRTNINIITDMKTMTKTLKVKNELDINSLVFEDKLDQFILLSSGTTGVPKCINYSLNKATKMFLTYKEVFQFNSKDKILIIRPMSYISGFAEFFAGFLSNSYLILQDQLTTEATLNHVLKFKPTYTSLPIQILYELIEKSAKNVDIIRDFSCLRILRSGGSYIPEKLITNLKNIFNIKLITLYGATECSPIMINDMTNSNKLTAMGKPLTDIQTKLVIDKKLTQQESVSIGELYIKSPWQFDGYLDQDNHLKKTNSWHATGDLVYQDSDGYYWFYARNNHMIQKGIDNISPVELENALAQHSNISSVVVCKRKDKIYNYVPVVWYTTFNKKVISKEEFRKFLKSYIKESFIPEDYIYTEELPKLVSGKVNIKLIQSMTDQYFSELGVTKSDSSI